MKRKTKPVKELSDWEWTSLIGALRYYENRATIVSASFPAEVVHRYFGGAYSPEACKRIANQFVEIDHHRGESDWAKSSDIDRNPWTKFYAFLRAYLNGFEKHRGVDCFYCETTKRHYPRVEYVSRPWLELYIGDEKETKK